MILASVIIPTANRPVDLEQTVTSLRRQTLESANYEIVVVENGPVDHFGIRAQVMNTALSSPAIHYFCDGVPGLLTGRHRGALEAVGDILVFVDDDIDADPGWLQAIVDTFADNTVQLVGGRNLPRYELPPPDWINGFRYTTPYGSWALGYLSLLDLGDAMLDIDANYIWGLNFAIRRQALFDLGGFHPDNLPDDLQHFQGDGETGLTMKAKARGCRSVYQPKALVHHRIPASRLTPEYFERRAFYQGVCDSYTHIRRTRTIEPLAWAPPPPEPWTAGVGRVVRKLPRYALHPLQHGRNFLARRQAEPARAMTVELDEAAMVKERVHHAYRAGYEFHRNAVAQDADLLAWVLRENYWDYRLPNLNRSAHRYPLQT